MPGRVRPTTLPPAGAPGGRLDGLTHADADWSGLQIVVTGLGVSGFAAADALLERGVYPPASQFESWFPSLANDDEAVDRTLEAAAEAFEEAFA